MRKPRTKQAASEPTSC